MKDKMIKTLTSEINKKICDDLKLYATDKKTYYNNKIVENENRIKELTEQNKQYSKIKKCDRDKPINGDAHLITYDEAIVRNKEEISYLKIDNKIMRKMVKTGKYEED